MSLSLNMNIYLCSLNEKNRYLVNNYQKMDLSKRFQNGSMIVSIKKPISKTKPECI